MKNEMKTVCEIVALSVPLFTFGVPPGLQFPEFQRPSAVEVKSTANVVAEKANRLPVTAPKMVFISFFISCTPNYACVRK